MILQCLHARLGREKRLSIYFQMLFFSFFLKYLLEIVEVDAKVDRKWKKGQRRLYFFFLFFLLSPKLSVVSFFFFDSFLSFFGEENDAVRCKCLACGRFFSPSQIAVVVVVDVSIDWKEVERICRPLFCPSISARLYLLSLYSKNLLLLGYNRETWRQPQTSHSAVCVCVNVAGSWLISARVHISKGASSFSPLQLDFPYIEWCIFRRVTYNTLCADIWGLVTGKKELGKTKFGTVWWPYKFLLLL